MEVNITTPSTFEIEIGNAGSVYSVNGQTGTVVLDYEDVGALSDETVIPTKTSELTNDSGFLTSHQSLAAYRTSAAQDVIDATKQDTISDLGTIRSGATLGSTAVQPAAITDMATKTWTQAQGYLTEHQSLAAYRTSAAQDVIDNGKQETLVSGTNIKTINSNSILGSGDIEIETEPEVFTATYDVTSYEDIETAYNAGKYIVVKYNLYIIPMSRLTSVTKTAEFTYFYSTNRVETLQCSLGISGTTWGVKSSWLAQKFLTPSAGLEITRQSEGDTITLKNATSSALGGIKPDDTTVEVNSIGVLNVKSDFINQYAKKTYVDSYHDSTKQDTLVSGTNIKTVNNNSLLGSGDITISAETNVFIATYDTTTYTELDTAYTAGKYIVVKKNNAWLNLVYKSAGLYIFSEVYYNPGSDVDEPTVDLYQCKSDDTWSSLVTFNMVSSTNIGSGLTYTSKKLQVSVPVPTQPSTGNYILKCVNGTLTWVEET